VRITICTTDNLGSCFRKGSFGKYIWSKVITAFISAVIVMVLGTSIFCLMAHFKMPLLSPDNDMLEYLADGDYLSQLITPETTKGFFKYFSI
jgi:hypothetical protein